MLNEIQKRAIALIEAQQKKFGAYSPVRMAGEQLKGIVLAEPDAAELLEQDLQKQGMGLEAAEKKIRARADEIHRNEYVSCVAVPPWEAEDVLRTFYGLRERTWGPGKEGESPHPSASLTPSPQGEGFGGRPMTAPTRKPDGAGGKIIDLADFF